MRATLAVLDFLDQLLAEQADGMLAQFVAQNNCREKK
jgi:hypothetical protein